MIKHLAHIAVGRGPVGFHHEAAPGTFEPCPVCGRWVIRLRREPAPPTRVHKPGDVGAEFDAWDWT